MLLSNRIVRHHVIMVSLCPSVKYTNNNQAFYSQASWGRLEMKSHEPKKQGQTRAKKKGKTKGNEKPNRKRRKYNKMLSQKREKGREKNLTKRQ
jgi:hypothetical protein